MKLNRNFFYWCCIITILIFSSIGLLKICNVDNELKDATFINAEPSIILNEIEYTLTNEILDESELEKSPIAKITDIDIIVSYIDEENPYKNPNLIYKIENIDIESKIALEVNDKIYLANKKDSIH